jgi:glycosyltransferase involved in cell wall biosynthesis
MKTIGVITNASKSSGVGSRAYHLYSRLQKRDDMNVVPVMLDGSSNTLEVDGKVLHTFRRLPGVLGSKSISWIRMGKHIPSFDIYDISNQTLSFLTKKYRPNILTVHDIIELTEPQDTNAALLNKYLLRGISDAQMLVAVSEYTKKSICDYFGISEKRITVIPNGADLSYAPIPNFKASIAYQQLKQDYKIGERAPVLLSVGSEHPRKNMKTILEVVARLKYDFPNILLLKVGDPGIASGRTKTLEQIDQLGLRSNVKFLGTIPQERINELYNIADALLFPSHAEGFGLPPLEAMAAGCLVACSDTTSLPEVVGNAAIMHDPDDADAFAHSIREAILYPDKKNAYIAKGLERAKLFHWDKSAEQMLALYKKC